MRQRTKILLGIGALIVAGGAYGLYEYNRGHETAADKEEVANVSATDLHAAFLADEAEANAKYVGTAEQAIRVSGVVRSVEEATAGTKTVILESSDPMAGVACDFAAADVPAVWKAGMSVSLKGICQGYTGEGMLPGDVILQRCTPVE